MDEPNNAQTEKEGIGAEMDIIKTAGSSAFMKIVEWAEKRVLVMLVIWTFVLLYQKDQELRDINSKFMNYLMEQKKAKVLSIEDKEEIIKKLSNEENID